MTTNVAFVSGILHKPKKTYLLFLLAVAWLFNGCVDVRREVTSPNGQWVALVMVGNGGAATNYSTHVSVISTAHWCHRKAAIWRPGNVLIADDDHGAVAVDSNGQISLNIQWASDTKLIIAYPEKARIFKQVPSFESVVIHYQSLKQ